MKKPGQDAFPSGEPGTVRRWRDPGISREERTLFLEGVLDSGNIRRAFWFSLFYLPMTIGGVVLNVVFFQEDFLGAWIYADVCGSLGFLGMLGYVLKKGGSIRWKSYLILAFYIYTLVIMGGYYFATLPRFGETSYYMLGMLMMAVIIHLPPRQFLPIQLGAHSLYLTLLLTSGVSADAMLTGVISGTNALILSVLASWFLFHREWENFAKAEIITRRNRELAEANARINEVMAITAHDLRSPLAGVLGLFEVLRTEREWSREPYASVLDDCIQTMGGSLALIGRMLDAHRAEEGKASLVRKQMNVEDMVESCVEKMRPSAALKSIHLETKSAGDSVIESSPEALGEALENLIANAVKFSPAGAQVLVSAGRDARNCRIEVRDNGPGIPEEERGKLFTKFHRGRNVPTGGEASTGLGLFIVRQLVESLGGSVGYEPASPHGSLFRITLPVG